MDLVRARSARLAIDGGVAVRTAAIPKWPAFDRADVAAVEDVLISGRVNYWTGVEGRKFEQEFAAWAGSSHAVALANGTIALETALQAIGVDSDADVVVPAATFIATASAVVRCGGRPVVVDVDRDSQCMTADTVEPALTSRTKAMIVVHLAGYPADMGPLLDLARRHDLRVIEDCAQAHGAHLAGKGVGTFGDIAAWSFCQDKNMTTAGEGGAVTTASGELWRRCWEYKDHGKSWAASCTASASPGFRWIHDSFGTNGRMTEIQAAIGRRQLHKLDAWMRHRRRNAYALRSGLSDLPVLRLPEIPDSVGHAFYRFYAHIRPELLAAGWDRDRVAAAIRAEGIPCAHGGCTEIYRERAFDSVGRPTAPLPVAAELGRTSLTLPVHPALQDDDISDVVAAVRKVCAMAAP